MKFPRDHLESTLAANLAGDDPFRLLVDAVTDYAIYMLDPAGHVASWNTGAKRFKGYEADEIIGRHFSVFYTEEDRRAGLPAQGAARPPSVTASSRPRAGACARTARASGRMSSSIRSGARRASCSASPRSPATSPNGRRPSSRCARRRRSSRSSSRASPTTRSTCSTRRPRRDLEPRRPAHQGIRRRPRSSASISRASTPRRIAPPASRARALETAARDGRFEKEGWRVRKDGTRFWANVVIDPIRGNDGQIRGFAKITRDITERRDNEQQARRTRARRCSSRRRWRRSASSRAAWRTISTTC